MFITTNHEDPPSGQASTPDPAAAAASGSASVEGAATPAAATLLTQGAGGEGGAAADAPAPIADVIAEKFRVMGADGKIDVEASARKQAEAYKQLETRVGSGDVAPKDPGDYKLEQAEGLGMEPADFEEFTKDPLSQAFIKGAHEKGMTNAQVNFVLNEYLKLAPDLAQANAQLRVEDARAELAKLWPDDAAMSTNLRSVSRAIEGFGGAAADMPGSKQRLYDKFGADPDFIAFGAAVAKEMKEDAPPSGSGSSEADVDALMKSPAYWNANDPQHATVKAKVAEFYARKHGATPR